MATRVHPVPSPLPAGTLDQWAGVVSTIAIDCVPGAIMLDPAFALCDPSGTASRSSVASLPRASIPSISEPWCM